MNSSDREIVNVSKNNSLFFEINQQTFNELLTFVDFADNKLNIGFVEINFAQDRDILIEALIKHSDCQDIQFEVLHFSDPDLRFLRDELVEKLKQIKIATDKKLILLITGLEKSIGVIEEYPDVLVNLNFVRDDLRKAVPHPLLLFVPDYGLTRLAKYAPDFWAWGRKVFYFKANRATLSETTNENNAYKTSIANFKLQEKQERIDLLLRLLSEYSSLDIQENKRNSPTLIMIYNQLGLAYDSLGYYQKALNYYQQSLKAAQINNNSSGIASTLNNLGTVYYYLREYQKSTQYYRQSSEIFQEINNSIGIVSTLNNLGNVYESLGEYQKAINYYQQSLKVAQEISNDKGIANTLNNLGTVYYSLGEYSTAVEYHQQSLQIEEEINNVKGIADSLNNLGSDYNSLGGHQQAIEYFQKSLQIRREMADRLGIADSLNNLANAYHYLGEYHQAIEYLQQSLEIKHEIGNHYGEAITWFNLGNTWTTLQEEEEAKTAYENAKKLYQAMKLNQEVEKCDRAIQDLENQ